MWNQNQEHIMIAIIKRRNELDAQFQWTTENVERLLVLNDRLTSLTKNLCDIRTKIEEDINTLIAQGKSYYKDFHTEGIISYDGDLPNVDWALSNYFYDQMKSMSGMLHTQSNLFDLNWNIKIFDRPEFDGHDICFMLSAMHDEVLYSLTDLCGMDIEKLTFSVRMQT